MAESETPRIALVTGAGSGIGRGTAQMLAAEGFQVVLAGRTRTTLEETQQQVPELVASLHPHPTDVSSEDSVASLFEMIEEQFGRLDLMFNNAGINIPAASVEEVALDDWKKVVDVNLTGMFLCTRGAIRLMKKQSPPGGRIINNGSISAHVPRPRSVAYTATKHAVNGLTKSTNLDCRDHGILCGQIDIGNADTDLVAKLQDVEPKMQVEDVAKAVVYMANLPLDTNVPFMTVMANKMSYMGRG